MSAPQLAGLSNADLAPAPPRLKVVDHDHEGQVRLGAFAKWSTPTGADLAAELDGARHWLGVPTHEILLAALGRAFARTLGSGVVAVGVTADGRGLPHAVPLTCATTGQASATETLVAARRLLAEESPYLGAVDVHLNWAGADPKAAAVLEAPRSDHALELRAYRMDGVLRLDWWYDTDRFDTYTVEELAEQFPLALIEMTTEAVADW